MILASVFARCVQNFLYTLDHACRNCAGSKSRAEHRLSNFVLRVAEDLEHVAFFDNDAFIHHDDAIADLFHYVHFVRDHDDRQTELLVNLLEELKRCLSGFRVKSRSGFVGKKNLRIGRKRTSNTDALFLTAGELRRMLVDVFA